MTDASTTTTPTGSASNGPTANANGAAQLRSPAAILAAACMASSGIVHAAAAGAHNTDATLATLFAVTAVVQLGWAAIAIMRPARWWFALGAVLAFGAVGFWAVTKVWGIGFIDGLAGSQPVATQDLVATVLEVVAGFAALRALWRPATNGRRTILMSRVAVVLGALALVAAVPASAAPHDGDHAHGASGDSAHAHGDGTEEGHDAVVVDGYEFHVDATDEEVAASQALVDDTRAALKETEFWNYQKALDHGYISIGDGITGFDHLIHIGYIANDNLLDPNEIESLVYRVDPDGTRSLVSAMYLLPFGYTMDTLPELGGDITVWHDHQDLCWDPQNPSRVRGVLDKAGNCPEGTVHRATQPMLHVWVVDHRCGPFAGIEGSHGEGCNHEH